VKAITLVSSSTYVLLEANGEATPISGSDRFFINMKIGE
jgi:hypothetical protein